ncbi:ABC transporter ATP-binding protein [Marinomonas primoryensis]
MEIKESESVAIVGSSGSGKSTLLGLLAGLDVNTSGEIFLYDNKFSSQTEEQRALVRGQYVGFVFQSFHLLPSLQAIENVMLPAELKGDKDARKKAEVLLEKVGLSHRLTHYPSQLSGGEQQRVAIARAFASNPKILFADEPTGNLDEENGNLIIKLLFDLNQSQGTTLVMVTHNNELAKMCDRQLVMSSGQLTEKTL